MDRFKGIIMIIGGFFLIFSIVIPEYKTVKSPAQDIYEINADEIEEGTHISGQIDFVYDYYATETQRETKLGITTKTVEDTKRWYIFPVYGKTENDTRFLTLRVSPKDYYTLDKIVDETFAYLNAETDTFGETTYTIDARAVKMDRELLQLYYEWYGVDASKDEADSYLVPYVLVPTMDMSMFLLVIGVSVILIIIGVLLTFAREK